MSVNLGQNPILAGDRPDANRRNKTKAAERKGDNQEQMRKAVFRCGFLLVYYIQCRYNPVQLILIRAVRQRRSGITGILRRSERMAERGALLTRYFQKVVRKHFRKADNVGIQQVSGEGAGRGY